MCRAPAKSSLGYVLVIQVQKKRKKGNPSAGSRGPKDPGTKLLAGPPGTVSPSALECPASETRILAHGAGLMALILLQQEVLPPPPSCIHNALFGQ